MCHVLFCPSEDSALLLLRACVTVEGRRDCDCCDCEMRCFPGSDAGCPAASPPPWKAAAAARTSIFLAPVIRRATFRSLQWPVEVRVRSCVPSGVELSPLLEVVFLARCVPFRREAAAMQPNKELFLSGRGVSFDACACHLKASFMCQPLKMQPLESGT